MLPLLTVIIFIWSLSKVQAQLLKPDSAYGINGTALFPNVTISNPSARVATAMQKDGKVLLTANGKNILTNVPAFITVRFTASGQPDLSFGNNGLVLTTITPFSQQATAIATQKDNKIISGGWAIESNNEMAFALARYLPDGQIDVSFGNNGKVLTNFRNGEQECMQAMSLQDDGKILACGYTFETNSEIVIARYTSKGQPDSSFNSTGYFFLSLTPSSYQAANTIIGLPDGKILVGGVYSNTAINGNFQSILLRLNNDGSIDKSFGINGKASTSSSETFVDLKRRPDNKILALGFKSIVRYTEDGVPDISFGTANGETSIPGTTSLRSMQVLEDGSIIVTGLASNDFVVYKLNKNGIQDNNFGINGQLIIPAGQYRSRSNTLMQRAGRIYIGGGSESTPGGNNRFTVVKLANSKVSSNPVFRLFPNPVTDQLFIETDTDIQYINLYNSIGQLVKTWSNNERQLDFMRFAAATYFIKVKFINGFTITEKIVKTF